MVKNNFDIFVVFIFIIISIYCFFVSIRMPIPRTIWDSPGLMPAVFSVLLFLLSVIFIIKRKHSDFKSTLSISFLKSVLINKNFHKTILFLLLLSSYIFIFIPMLGFYLPSWLFMIVSMKTYVQKLKKHQIFLIASLSIFLFYLIFNFWFRIPLNKI